MIPPILFAGNNLPSPPCNHNNTTTPKRVRFRKSTTTTLADHHTTPPPTNEANTTTTLNDDSTDNQQPTTDNPTPTTPIPQPVFTRSSIQVPINPDVDDSTRAAAFQESVLSIADPDWQRKLPVLYAADPIFAIIYSTSQLSESSLSPIQRATVKYYSIIKKQLYYTNCDTDGDKPKPRLCIPNSNDNFIRRLIIFEAHDALLHQSRDKTFLRISKLYFWPTLRRDIRRYVNACRSCRTLKTQQQPTRGFSSSPAIPRQRMSELHIDFMVGLLESSEGFDSILVAVCALTGFLFLIPCSSRHKSIDIARLLFKNIFYIHGPPTILHSDRDRKFVSEVFSSLMSFFNIERKMSTSYNHNPNGAAEIAIKTVEVLLRHVLSHHPDRQFPDFTPLCAYAYNSSVKKTHEHSPYMALHGFEPLNPSILLAVDLPEPTADQLPTTDKLDTAAVKDFILHQQVVLREIQDAIQASQRTVELFQNSDRRDIKFSPGSFVYLNTENLATHYFSRSELKFQDKFFGPFRIMEKVSAYTYRLKLPDEMKLLYNVFHVALLWAYIPPSPDLLPLRTPDFSSFSSVPEKPAETPPTGLPTPAHELPDDPAQLDIGEYEVNEILSRRPRGRGFQYLVSWKGYSSDHDSWIPRSSLATEGMSQALTAFDRTMGDKDPAI